MSLRLNFACGQTTWEGFDNSDINGEVSTSYVDLEYPPYPYDDESAELILISHALQMTTNGEPTHPDKRKIIAEFYRILEPGGWLRIDDNPSRIYRRDEDISASELVAESGRGFPPELQMSRAVLIDLLRQAGFREVVELSTSETRIPAEPEVRAAILGNHAGHYSFTVEARK